MENVWRRFEFGETLAQGLQQVPMNTGLISSSPLLELPQWERSVWITASCHDVPSVSSTARTEQCFAITLHQMLVAWTQNPYSDKILLLILNLTPFERAVVTLDHFSLPAHIWVVTAAHEMANASNISTRYMNSRHRLTPEQ